MAKILQCILFDSWLFSMDIFLEFRSELGIKRPGMFASTLRLTGE